VFSVSSAFDLVPYLRTLRQHGERSRLLVTNTAPTHPVSPSEHCPETVETWSLPVSPRTPWDDTEWDKHVARWDERQQIADKVLFG
jgi:hypothetical protein